MVKSPSCKAQNAACSPTVLVHSAPEKASLKGDKVEGSKAKSATAEPDTPLKSQAWG